MAELIETCCCAALAKASQGPVAAPKPKAMGTSHNWWFWMIMMIMSLADGHWRSWLMTGHQVWAVINSGMSGYHTHQRTVAPLVMVINHHCWPSATTIDDHPLSISKSWLYPLSPWLAIHYPLLSIAIHPFSIHYPVPSMSSWPVPTPPSPLQVRHWTAPSQAATAAGVPHSEKPTASADDSHRKNCHGEETIGGSWVDGSLMVMATIVPLVSWWQWMDDN